MLKEPVTIVDRQVALQPCIVIPSKKTVGELPAFLGQAYGRLYSYASAKTTPGMPFARYLDWGSDLIDFEAGVMVTDPLPGEGEIKAGVVGGKRTLYALYTGPYHEIGPVYEAMQAFMRDHSLTAAGAPYEVYLNDPQQVKESELQTEVYWPVSG